MSMTDPVADLLTRIRNGQQAAHKEVAIPASKLKVAIAQILKDEGYVTSCKVVEKAERKSIVVRLKYSADKKGVITKIDRASKPGLRRYVGATEIPSVLNGLGIAVLSTSKGIVTDKKARELGVGGEILFTVY